MSSVLRKLRAALAIGSIWGAAFATVGAALGAVLPATSFLGTTLGLGIVTGIGGFGLGVVFAGLLSAMERRRTLGDLTARRGALWGFVAGSSLALLGSAALGSLLGVVAAAEELMGLAVPVSLQMAALLTGAVSCGAISAALASATVSLAKRAPEELRPGAVGSNALIVESTKMPAIRAAFEGMMPCQPR